MTHFTAAVLVVTTLSPVLAEEAPSSTEVISAIDNFASTDDTVKAFSLQIDLPVDDGVPARFNLCWNSGGHFSFLLSESKSGTPVALFTDQQFFLYDVVDGTFMVGSGIVPSLSLAAGEETIKLKFSFARNSDAPEFDVNLVSFLKGIQTDTELISTDDTTTLSHASPSELSTTIWTFDRGTPTTLKEIQIRRRKSNGPDFRVSRIRKDTASEYVAFPKLNLLPCEITKWDPDNNIVAALELFTQSLRAVAGQAAIADPRFRELKLFSKDVDWTQVQQNAEALRRPLLDLVSPAVTSFPTSATEQPDAVEP